MKTFTIDGKISFYVEFSIDAETEEQAIEKAKERILDYYHLEYMGGMHVLKTESIDISAEEEE